MENHVVAAPGQCKADCRPVIGAAILIAAGLLLFIRVAIKSPRQEPKDAPLRPFVRLVPPSGITHGPDGSLFWSNYEKVDYVTTPSTHSRLVAAIIGGEVGDFLVHQKSCGGRLSWALDKSDYKIPMRPGAWVNRDDRSFGRFILRARLMRLYLSSIWGKPNYSGRFHGLRNGDPKWLESIGLNDGVGIFAADGHVGVLKKGYKDPYFADQDEGEVYFLRFAEPVQQAAAAPRVEHTRQPGV